MAKLQHHITRSKVCEKPQIVPYLSHKRSWSFNVMEPHISQEFIRKLLQEYWQLLLQKRPIFASIKAFSQKMRSCKVVTYYSYPNIAGKASLEIK
ncbi:hypothetical protein NPIL_246791 [Nephila pilipes]|uniref:Uncharacterized protein n=1 Tax=Nephila pilipes TaxID=299642 RepID=A0A8X6QSY9_NEPPI|nr:hypothetical protein NPIL_246791 [Nephila pilipes]